MKVRRQLWVILVLIISQNPLALKLSAQEKEDYRVAMLISYAENCAPIKQDMILLLITSVAAAQGSSGPRDFFSRKAFLAGYNIDSIIPCDKIKAAVELHGNIDMFH